MAFVYEESFSLSDGIRSMQPNLAKDMDDLLDDVNKALRRLSGPPVITSVGPLYSRAPKGLNAKVWSDTIISYDPDKNGASADYGECEIIIGYFFAHPRGPLVMEKVILHEFLHLVLFSQRVPKPFHHGQIDEIIERRLPGPANPFGTVGWDCGN